MRTSIFPVALLGTGVALAVGCGDSPKQMKTDAERRAEVTTGMHGSIAADIADLVAGTKELQAAAPTGHGWGAGDATAIAAMKAAWKKCRVAYEHIEGALAPLFPDIDFAIDARYDDQLAALDAAGDADAFDGEGVTGMHAIERVLYADGIRAEVIVF